MGRCDTLLAQLSLVKFFMYFYLSACALLLMRLCIAHIEVPAKARRGDQIALELELQVAVGAQN